MELDRLSIEELEALVAGLSGLADEPPLFNEGETLEGLPGHFSVLPERDKGIPEVGLSEAPARDPIEYYQGAANRNLYDVEQMKKDPRGPLKQFADHVLRDQPYYEGQEDPSGVVEDFALAPLRGLNYAGEQGYEGVKEGRPFQVAGSAALAALMALPFVGRGAQKASKSFVDMIPQTGKDVAKITGPAALYTGAVSSIDGKIDQAIAGDEYQMSDFAKQTVEKMRADREKYIKQITDLESSKLPESKASAAGKDIKAIQRKLGFTDKEIDGAWGNTTTKGAEHYNNKIDQQIAKIQSQIDALSDDKISQFVEGERRKAKDEADAQSEKDRNTVSRDLYPGLAEASGAAGLLASGFLGYRLGRKKADNYNKETAEISRQWRAANKKAKDPRNLTEADIAARSSVNFAKSMDDAYKRSEQGKWLPHLAHGGIADFGLAVPDIVDSMRGLGGKDLDLGTLGRIAVGMLAGGSLSKTAMQTGLNHRGAPKRYDAESEGLRDIVNSRGGPIGYHNRKATDRAVETEGLHQSQHRRRQHDAFGAELERRRAQDELQALKLPQSRGFLARMLGQDQGPQNLRQSLRDVSGSSKKPLQIEKQQLEPNTKAKRRQMWKHTTKKKEAVLKGLREGKPVKQLAKKHGVGVSTIYDWRKEMKNGGPKQPGKKQ